MADSTGNINGFGGIFYQLKFSDGTDLTRFVTSLDYTYDEEDDEAIEIKMDFENVDNPDNGVFLKKSEWKLVWGYMDGPISPERKIYLQDTKWEYTNSNLLTLTAQFTEKANSLKYDDSQEVFNNHNVLDLIHAKAKQYKLSFAIEFERCDIDFSGYSFNDSLSFEDNLKANRDFQIKKQTDKWEKDNKSGKFIMQKYIIPHDTPDATRYIENQLGPGLIDLSKQFPTFEPIPQANLTEKQVIEKYINKIPGGWIMDTRDDEIILRKRNFNQVPYRTYVYRGTNGLLISFTPMSRIRAHKKNSSNVGVSGWNPEDKTHFSGNTNNNTSPPQTVLSKYLSLHYAAWKAGWGDAVLPIHTKMENILPSTDQKFPIRGQNDPILPDYLTKGITFHRARAYTIKDEIEAAKNAYANAYLAQSGNQLYDPTEVQMAASMDKAENRRRRSQLQMNPATATVYGDPGLVVGKLITIFGVSKKYSGNYYITKAKHSPGKGGYLTELELVRSGHNNPDSPEDVLTKDYGKVMNSSIGPENPTITKSIKTKNNPQ